MTIQITPNNNIVSKLIRGDRVELVGFGGDNERARGFVSLDKESALGGAVIIAKYAEGTIRAQYLVPTADGNGTMELGRREIDRSESVYSYYQSTIDSESKEGNN
ncbi:MAG TPA: hypothetical protein VJK51_05265 [Candidatus Nanoarchaeia archaeon]|nr:hypothetical protein [Candidatus Nanoarchaeia archaeon]